MQFSTVQFSSVYFSEKQCSSYELFFSSVQFLVVQFGTVIFAHPYLHQGAYVVLVKIFGANVGDTNLITNGEEERP